MSEWIPFEKGTYLVSKAFLVGSADRAVALEDAIVEIYTDGSGHRAVKGRAFVSNALVVELLETGDELDLMLDLGEGFRYRLINPDIVAGKVFAPDVKSVLQFFPTEPWQEVSAAEFNQVIAGLKVLGGDRSA